MRSNRGAARAAVVLGALAVLAIPAGVVAAQLSSQLRLLETLYVAVAAAAVLGLLGRLGRPPRPPERGADAVGGGRRRLRARRRLVGRLRGHHRGAGARGVRHPALGAVAARTRPRLRFARPCSRSGTAFGRHVSVAGSTSPRRRSATKVRGQVPARARGRAVRAAARADVRQGVPPHVRGVPRSRRAAVRRRVQLAVRQRRGVRAARPALGGETAAAPPSPAGDERRVRRAGGDRDPDGDRHLRVEGERQQLAGGAAGEEDADRRRIGRRSSRRCSR